MSSADRVPPDRYCFIKCTSEADCAGINDHPANPVICTTMAEGQVCAQSSEP